MTEIKGQLLGIVLVIGLFITVSGVVTAIVTALTNKVQTDAEKLGVDIEYEENALMQNLLHY